MLAVTAFPVPTRVGGYRLRPEWTRDRAPHPGRYVVNCGDRVTGPGFSRGARRVPWSRPLAGPHPRHGLRSRRLNSQPAGPSRRRVVVRAINWARRGRGRPRCLVATGCGGGCFRRARNGGPSSGDRLTSSPTPTGYLVGDEVRREADLNGRFLVEATSNAEGGKCGFGGWPRGRDGGSRGPGNRRIGRRRTVRQCRADLRRGGADIRTPGYFGRVPFRAGG
jgi:hypothetical protein